MLCALFDGARPVRHTVWRVRHSKEVLKNTNNHRRVTIRVAKPYNDSRKTKILLAFFSSSLLMIKIQSRTEPILIIILYPVNSRENF